MKIHWGWLPVVSFISFAIYILYFVVNSFDVPLNMVTKDYYAEELNLAGKKAMIANTKALSERPKIKPIGGGELQLSMPAEIKNPEGSIHFYRPSDSEMDIKAEIKLDTQNHQKINTSHLQKGRWVAILEWEDAGKGYYYEQSLLVP